ncbi:MAG: DUF4296 domain-containing protein [Candidatus Azobacteroides sp.]|nr:DUF4296 domain-containing protein [Candidatus Azobacteroides sp.]
MRKLFQILSVFLLFSMIFSCTRNPYRVIGKGDMEDLLVDVYISEALVQNNQSLFNPPEKKEALYRSVLEKHGVTRKRFDTSLYWYGQHYDIYSKICNKVTDRLKNEKITFEKMASASRLPKQKGDTVNIWRDKPRFATWIFLSGYVLDYEIKTDTSYHAKDRYELRLVVSGLAEKDSTNVSQMELKLNYAGDSVFATRTNITRNGRITLQAAADSLVPQSVSGYVSVTPTSRSKNIMIDRIQLFRIRNNSSK